MTEGTDEALSERAQLLLKALIENYIRDGQPVGSRTLSRDSGLSLSSATIRNVMADLEELGFVVSPAHLRRAAFRPTKATACSSTACSSSSPCKTRRSRTSSGA